MPTSDIKDSRAVIIGTCGHIDHGKTSLVRALTGVDTDALAEEKERGLSIDLGFAWMELGDGAMSAAIVDVPGHDRFIRNMLAGATGIDIALLCIAADDGIMPQTIEHLDIINLLGVSRGVVVITKSDVASDERIREVASDVAKLLSKTLLEGAPVVNVSTHTGDGIDELRLVIEALVSETVKAEAKSLKRRGSDPLRLPVDRSFSIKGFGTVVTGTVFSGTLTDGDEVILYPSAKRVRVRGIESHHEKTSRISVGARAAVNLSAVSKGELKRGDLLLSPSLSSYRGSLSFDCSLQSLKSNSHKLKSGRSLKLYHMTSEASASVRLSGTISLNAGERGYGRVYLKSPLFVLRGDRFILRDPSINSTVGGGRVLLPYPAGDRQSLLKSSVVDFKALGLSEDGAQENLGLLLNVLILNGRIMRLNTISLMLNVRCAELKEYLKGKEAEHTMLGEDVMSRAMLKSAEDAVVDTLRRYHEESPAELGVKESALLAKMVAGETLKASVKAQLPTLMKDGLLDRLTDSSGSGDAERLTRSGAVYLLPGHEPASSGEDKVIEDAVMGLFGDACLALKVGEIVKDVSADAGEIKRVLRNMVERESIVRLKEGLYMSGASVSAAMEKLTAYLKDKDGIKASDFRDILGCGRKLAIEILEYFDGVKITLRSGDVRTLR